MLANTVSRSKATEQANILWPELLLVAGVLLAQLKGGIVTTLTLMGLCIWALRGPKHAIQALSLSWLIAFLNPGIFINLEIKIILRWLILLAAFGRVVMHLIQHRLRASKEIIILLLFFLTTLLFSVIKSYAPIISSLKLSSFTIGVITILLAFELTADQKTYWKSWFTTIFLLIIICGSPLYFSELGYFRNGRGFQGLISHPQSYSVFIAPMISWITWRFLFEKDLSYPVIIGVVLGWSSLYASLSRTGMLAALLGLGLTIIIRSIKKAKLLNTKPHKSINHLYVASICLISIIIIINWSSIYKNSLRFLRKGITGKSVLEIYNRDIYVKRSINNFMKNPVMGMGFGLSSNPIEHNIKTDKLTGVPISASTEKGFLISVMLEELGIIGSMLIVVLIFTITRPIIEQNYFGALSLLLTCLIVNMGEMVFFSFGGMGLYIWLLIGFARVDK